MQPKRLPTVQTALAASCVSACTTRGVARDRLEAQEVSVRPRAVSIGPSTDGLRPAYSSDALNQVFRIGYPDSPLGTSDQLMNFTAERDPVTGLMHERTTRSCPTRVLVASLHTRCVLQDRASA